MRWWVMTSMLWAAGCVEVICTVPDAGCPPAPERCNTARALETCDQQGASCGCCLAGAPSCDLLGCDMQGDGGLAWYSYSGTPPQLCK